MLNALPIEPQKSYVNTHKILGAIFAKLPFKIGKNIQFPE